MATYIGWEVTLKLNKWVLGEDIGTGDGSTVEFGPVANLPIGDTSGDNIVDKDDVVGYEAGVEASVASIVAATGMITFTSAPASGAAVTIDYAYENTVGYATSVSFEVTRATEFVQVVGQVAPYVKEGPRQITGTIEHLVVNDLWYATIGAESDYLTECVIIATIGTVIPKRIVTIMGAKLDPYSADIPQDDRTTESVDFKATSITWTNVIA